MVVLAEEGEVVRDGFLAARVGLLRAIHDGPVQELAGIAFALDAVAEQPGRTLRDCAANVRRVLTELRTILDQATGELIDDDEPTPAPWAPAALAFAVPDDTELELDLEALDSAPPDVRAAAASFIDEGVRNACKHAVPTCIAINAVADCRRLRVTVENDGVHDPAGDPGVGLRLLELDAARLGGNLSATRMEERWQLSLTLPVAD